jgi:hypothetical protein
MKIPFGGDQTDQSCIQDLPLDRDFRHPLQRRQSPGNVPQVRLTSIIPCFKRHSKRKL